MFEGRIFAKLNIAGEQQQQLYLALKSAVSGPA
jgi:hypothetical protein